VHEPKLDGWRCLAQVSAGKVHLWSRSGHDWSRLVPELGCLAALGDIVLDGELVAAGPDGRADFELLGARMMGPAHHVPVCLYAFDALSIGGRELVDRLWLERRAVLDWTRASRLVGPGHPPPLPLPSVRWCPR
jgi:bifunctional non-homologous end joining protein LigD